MRPRLRPVRPAPGPGTGEAVRLASILVVIVAAIAIWVVAGCDDQTRHNCLTQATAPRCDTSNGATTP